MADAVAPRPARRAKPARSALCDRSNGTGEEQLASAAQQVQPADDAMTTAEHAARLSLPRISAENAAQHPPPSLHDFRRASARAPANSVPALWFWQMTGEEWLRDGHSFDIEKKRHRRMVWRAGSNPSARLHAYLHRVTPLCIFLCAARRLQGGGSRAGGQARPQRAPLADV